MKITARPALWRALEKARKLITPADQRALWDRLAALDAKRVELSLHNYRSLGIMLVRSTSSREREKILAEINDRAFALYAGVAWTARTLALMEFLEGFEFELPEKWAANQAIDLMERFESNQAWLWPFEGQRPWPDEDEDES